MNFQIKTTDLARILGAFTHLSYTKTKDDRSGIFFELDADGALLIVATNGAVMGYTHHRLSETCGTGSFLLPLAAAKEILKSLKNSPLTTVELADRAVPALTLDGERVYDVYINNVYPMPSTYFPSEAPLESVAGIGVNLEEFNKISKAALALTGTAAVKIVLPESTFAPISLVAQGDGFTLKCVCMPFCVPADLDPWTSH